MRILHVLGRLNPGGVESWLVQVLREMHGSRFHCDFLVHTTDEGAYDAEARSLGARIIPCLHPHNPASYTWNFLRIMREHGPYDVVHSHVHYFSSYVLLLAACAGVPVRIAHSHTDTRLIDDAAQIGSKFYRTAMRQMLPRVATGGLAVSVGAAETLFPAGWQRSPRWMLSYLGIDLERFRGPVDSLAIRRELGLESASLVIGHVGRIDQLKNQSFIVDIATELLKREPRTMFLLVGDGPQRSFVEDKVQNHGLEDHFVFTGRRPDVPDLLRGAMDVFLFPSILEGLPITLLEAQAAGLPCLVSDAVTTEADMAADSMVRLSLRKTAREWAEELTRVSRFPRPAGDEACSRVEARSIHNSALALADGYEKFAALANYAHT